MWKSQVLLSSSYVVNLMSFWPLLHQPWRSLQMERELVAIFFISETKRDFDQVQQNHFNSFKKLVDFQNLKGVVTLTSMGAELQSQNHVDVNYGKTFGLGPQLTKALWKSNISLCLSQKQKSLAPKLTAWRPFILQNSNGRGGLNF